eukprot:scaffold25163_cov63-Phaeocystis_antarctica.AAC.2
MSVFICVRVPRPSRRCSNCGAAKAHCCVAVDESRSSLAARCVSFYQTSRNCPAVERGERLEKLCCAAKPVAKTSVAKYTGRNCGGEATAHGVWRAADAVHRASLGAMQPHPHYARVRRVPSLHEHESSHGLSSHVRPGASVLCVPASCVPYVPKAKGSLPRVGTADVRCMPSGVL